MVTHAKPSTGSCVNYDFPISSTDPDTIDTEIPVRVLRQGTPLYRYSDSFKIIKKLNFDTDLKPIRQSSERVQVKEYSSQVPSGWIYKEDLLCQTEHPLMVRGLPRKAFAKTLMDDGFGIPAPIYSSPDKEECYFSCEPLSHLSRFGTYFVFSEDKENRRYLLGRGFILSGGFKRFPLVGWIDEERMIPWNTNLGLRPKNDTRYPSKTGPILAYYTLHDSKINNKEKAFQILEGNIWYTFPMHMLLIEKIDGHYHVIYQSCGKTMPCLRNNWGRDFYIPIKLGQMQEEVILIERQIDRWNKLLQPLVRLGSRIIARDNREEFVQLFHEAVQGIIGYPPIQIGEPRTLSEFFESSGQTLPYNPHSPLLQYTFDELQEIEDCEMQRLIDRLRMSRSLLTKVIANPTLGVSYTLQEYENRGCPLSDKGKKIKRMRFGTRRKLGEDDSYRYGHVLKGITLYWLPMEFLP